MSLDFFDVVGSFAQGVNKGAKEADLAIIERMKELDGKTGSDTVKTKYTEEYKKYMADKDLIQQVESAGGPGNPEGQRILGGYENMDDYMKAVTMNPDLYHPMIFAGEEPIHTPAQYGLTNVRDDGSTITTSGRIFNKFFRPEVFAKNEAEAAASVDVVESTTTYRRDLTKKRDPADIAASKTSLAEAHRLYYHSKKEKKLEVITAVEGGGYEKNTYVLTPDGTTGKGVNIEKNPALKGYQILSTEPWDDPSVANEGTTLEYTVNRWLTPDGEIANNNKSGENTPIGVKIKAIKTDNPADSVTTAVGTKLPQYRILGREIIEPTEETVDKKTTRGQEWDEDIDFIMDDYELLPTRYNNIMKIMGYVNEDETPMKLTPHIALAIAQRADAIGVNVVNGLMVDKYAEQFGMADTLDEIAVEKDIGFTKVTVKMAQLYAGRYLDEQEYYDNLNDRDYYKAHFENEILTFANKHKTSLTTASNVISKILQTAMTDEKGNSWWLGFKDFTGQGISNFDENAVIWADENQDYTVANIINGLGAQKNKKINKDKSWEQVTDDILLGFKEARKKMQDKCAEGDSKACELLQRL